MIQISSQYYLGIHYHALTSYMYETDSSAKLTTPYLHSAQ